MLFSFSLTLSAGLYIGVPLRDLRLEDHSSAKAGNGLMQPKTIGGYKITTVRSHSLIAIPFYMNSL